MTVSVITVTFNSAKTLRQTIESVLSQDYPALDYIFVDGQSSDETLEIIQSYGNRIRYISEPDKGIYDAMNKGVSLAKGEVIGIINSDDFYPGNQVISRVCAAFEDPSVHAVYGDLQYVDLEDTSKVLRNWKAGNYRRKNFLNGWMPPHPTFFLRKSAFEKYGLYDPSFKSAGDYELMLRMLYKHDLRATYIPCVQMKMRAGGISNASIKNRIRANKEDRRAWAINQLRPAWYTLFLKPLSKLSQWL